MPKLKSPISLNRINTKGNKRKLLGLAIILAIVAAGWVVYDNVLRDDRKVYAEAAGHKIYEEDVRDLIGENQGITEQQAAKVLADKYLTEALAEEQGISISDEELVERYGESINKHKEENKYAYQYHANLLYFSKFQTNNRGVYKGKMLMTNFSRNIAGDLVLPEDRAQNPDLGNPKAIAKDKKYAEDLITSLYNQVKAGEITFDEAIKIEHDDPKLGEKAYPTLPHSGSFDTTRSPDSALDVDSIRQRISEIKVGELTEPFVVDIRPGEETVESYFLVVQMDESSGGGVTEDFEQYLENAKQRLVYAIYV